MHKHYHLIKLIVATAALIGLGFIAFKFVVKRNNPEVKIQYTVGPVGLDLTELSKNI